MKTYKYDGEVLTLARSHPWTDAVASSGFRYYDMKMSPTLIRTSLEDFLPWSRYPAVDRFYALLEWLNGATSPLESNDCEFTAPHPNKNPQFRKSLECSGRVMVLFRDLSRNLSPHDLLALTNALHDALATADPHFEFGIVGTTLIPVRYVTLLAPSDAQLGSQLMLSFWAWGNTKTESMTNLDRLMKNLSHALRDVAKQDAAEKPNTPSRFKKQPPLHPERSGTVQCLGCGVSFVSWDRRYNRLCSSCSNRR
jgi:hypothetical protein